MQDLKIEVTGLSQLNRGLRTIDKDAPKQLRLTLNEVGDRFVGWVKPTVPSVR